MAKLAKHQKFVMERLNRKDIVGHPANPRKIDPYTRKKLEENLRKVGLLGPITVNRRTGRIVGGHQRIACMDAIEGRDDYDLDVAVVDLTLAQEKEALVALNNHSLQGDWDTDLLKQLITAEDFDLTKSGFDPVEIQLMFPEDEDVATLFAEPIEAEAEAEERAPKEYAPDDDRLEKIKAKRQHEKEKMLKNQDTEFYAVVVFQTRAQREAFFEGLNLASSNRYVDGARVAFMAGITLPEEDR